MDTKKLSKKNITILSDLNKLNNEQLFSLYFDAKLQDIETGLFQYSIADRFTLKPQNQENIFIEKIELYKSVTKRSLGKTVVPQKDNFLK